MITRQHSRNRICESIETEYDMKFVICFEVELPNNSHLQHKIDTNRDGNLLHLMGLEALQAGAEVPGRLGPVMWNWEDSATWGRLPPGWLYLKLALHAVCDVWWMFLEVFQLSISRRRFFV